MKLLMYIIGIILGITGFLSLVGSIIILIMIGIDGSPFYQSSIFSWIFSMIFSGIVPLIGGVFLCKAAAKIDTPASDNRIKRLGRKIFLEDSSRKSEGENIVNNEVEAGS